MAEWERRRFRVAGCRRGFGCRRSTPKRHTTQIRSENWGKERGVGPNPTLSLSLSHFKVLLCLGDSSVSRSCLWRTQNFFKKKKRKGEHSSGIDFRGLTSTRVGHGYLAKIVVSRQHSLDVYDAYALHRIFFFFFFGEKVSYCAWIATILNSNRCKYLILQTLQLKRQVIYRSHLINSITQVD